MMALDLPCSWSPAHGADPNNNRHVENMGDESMKKSNNAVINWEHLTKQAHTIVLGQCAYSLKEDIEAHVRSMIKAIGVLNGLVLLVLLFSHFFIVPRSLALHSIQAVGADESGSPELGTKSVAFSPEAT